MKSRIAFYEHSPDVLQRKVTTTDFTDNKMHVFFFVVFFFVVVVAAVVVAAAIFVLRAYPIAWEVLPREIRNTETEVI